MNPHQQRLELARRYVEGTATADETRALEEALRTDAEFRRQFLRYANVDAALGSGRLFVAPVARAAPVAHRPAWLQWRPLTAAAVGLVIGLLSASVVLAYVAPSRGKVVTLLQESFDSGPAPRVTGVPTEAGVWSGDYSEVVGEQQGVKPESGQKMLRLSRADYEGKAAPQGSYVGDVYRLMDLRPTRHEFADGGAVVQVSAAFNAFAFPEEERYGISVAVYALSAELASSPSGLGNPSLANEALAMARKILSQPDRDPRTWQKVEGELRLPPDTEFLLIHLSVTHATREQKRDTFDGHFLDDVRVTLARRARLP